MIKREEMSMELSNDGYRTSRSLFHGEVAAGRESSLEHFWVLTFFCGDTVPLLAYDGLDD